MLKVRLRTALEAYHRRTGQRMTYECLAERTGLSKATIQSVGAREGYNPTLDTIDRILTALECPVEDLLEHLPDGTRSLPPVGTSSSNGAPRS